MFVECSRRSQAARRFTLLSSQDDSDALLDDDDVDPLDLNMDFGIPDRGHDDTMLNPGKYFFR